MTFSSSFILHIGSTVFLENKQTKTQTNKQNPNDTALFLIFLPSYDPLTPTVNIKKPNAEWLVMRSRQLGVVHDAAYIMCTYHFYFYFSGIVLAFKRTPSTESYLLQMPPRSQPYNNPHISPNPTSPDLPFPSLFHPS